jgi:hypothetical protein
MREPTLGIMDRHRPQRHPDGVPQSVGGSRPGRTQKRLGVPADAKPGQTIHFIPEATDDGTPPLRRYQRIVLAVAD